MDFKRAALAALFFFCALGLASAREIRSVSEALRLGDQAFLYGQYAEAEKYYRLILKAVPGQAGPAARLGRLFYAEGRYAEARKMFEDALALQKDASTAKFIELSLQKMKDTWPLLEQLEKASAGSDKALVRRLHAQVLQRISGGSTLMALAAPHAEYLLKADPSDARLLRFLAEGYFLSGDSARAFPYYKKLSKREPGAELYRRMGDIAVNLGAYDEAREAYKRALREAVREKNPGQTKELKKLIRALPAFSDKIDALIESDQYEAAFRQLRKCLVRNSTNPWALVKMGALYERIGRMGQAENLYQKAVLWRPEDPAAHYALGRFYLFKKKKFEDALREFKIFQELLAEHQRMTTDETARKRLLENWREATRSLAYVYQDVLRQPRSAVVELGKLTGSGSATAEDYYSLGVAYLRDDKKKAAYESLQKAIQTDPKSKAAKNAQDLIASLRAESREGFEVKG